MKLLPLALLALGSTLSLGCTVTTREGPSRPYYGNTYNNARPVYVTNAGPAQPGYNQGYNAPPPNHSQPHQGGPTYSNAPPHESTAATPVPGRSGPSSPAVREPERGGGREPERGGREPERGPATQTGRTAAPASTYTRAPAPQDPGSGRTPGAVQLPERR